MNGIDPYAYLNQVSLKMDSLTQRDQIETVLDEVDNPEIDWRSDKKWMDAPVKPLDLSS